MVDKNTEDFWKGYSRGPEMALHLVAALNELMARLPHMRLGQILQEAHHKGGGQLDTFYTMDEDFLTGMNEYLAQIKKGN